MSAPTALQTFNFNSHAFRVITGGNGEPWFIAKDVADCLGYADPAQAVKQLCKKAVNFTNASKTVVNEIKELHRTKALIIPESDVYRLIMRSSLPSAEDFQALVCEEILPSIRKTGGYTHGQSTQQPSLITVATELEGAIKIANLFGFTGNQALLSANKATEVTTGVNCQLLLGVEFVADKKEHAITPSDIGVRLGGISGIKANQILKDAGFQIDNRTAKNAIYWTPTDKGNPYAQLTDTHKKHSDGTPIKQVKWYESVIDLIAA
jgi:prophage antirepressor-like protein